MTRIATALLMGCALLMASPNAEARKGGPFGLGIMLGDPSGLAFKYHLGGQNAVDGGLGFSVRHDWLHLHVDYLYHFPQTWGGASFLPYVGIGGKLAIWDGRNGRSGYYDDDDDDFALGVRVPLGIAWEPKSAPIDLFVEIVPALWVLPGTNIDFDFALGGRFYF